MAIFDNPERVSFPKRALFDFWLCALRQVCVSLIRIVLGNVAFVFGLVKELFASSLGLVLRRAWLFSFLNAIFFGSMVAAALVTGKQPIIEEGGVEDGFAGLGGWVVMFVSVFLFNLVVSGFLLVTVSGLLFFGLSFGWLVVRGAMWGLMLNQLSTPAFLAAFPTLLLEGEGYVIAGVAGAVLGLSWLKPTWAGWEDVSRRAALKQAAKECAYLYVLVAILLLAAAAAETATLYLF